MGELKRPSVIRTLVRIANALERIADSMETDREVLERVADGLDELGVQVQDPGGGHL